MISSLAFYFASHAKVGAFCNLKGGQGGSFFGVPHWWKYLRGRIDEVDNCSPAFKFPDDAWLVGLAVIDILLFLAGIIAVVAIIWGGVSYIISMGSPDKTTAARKRIQNALIGLGVIIIASAVVSFIGKSLGGQ